MSMDSVIQRTWHTLLFALMLTASAWGAAGAQTTTARITGTVTTAGGLPVPQAQVTARNVATNVQRNALSSDQGIYTIPGLQPGVYEVTARRIGMQPQSRRVRAQIGQTLNVDFQLAEAAVG